MKKIEDLRSELDMKVSNMSWKTQEWRSVSSEFLTIDHSVSSEFSRTKQRKNHKNHLNHLLCDSTISCSIEKTNPRTFEFFWRLKMSHLVVTFTG